jgi:hypothetical protein
VIAKEIAMPKTGGSFRGLVTYLTSSRGSAERVGQVRLTNCVSADVASAVLEVENTQARNRRARHSTYHLMLSFPAREEPRADVLEAIERRACHALGFGEHQRVSVVHHDTDHLHVHIAINRVHPKAHNVHWPSYSKLVLDRLCVELEQEHGLLPVRHRARERAAHLEATDALRTSLQGDCALQLRQARTWAELHKLAAAHGVQVQLRANGLALVARDGSRVRASSVDRDLSKAALERRLGPFEVSAQLSPTVDCNKPEARPCRAPDIERLGGIETLIGWIQRECAERFRGARSWNELHEVAAAHGLRVKLHGNGLIFMTRDGITTKASSIGRDLSKAALERRLGAFEAGPTAERAARAEYKALPVARDNRTMRLYDQYRREREAAFDARARAIAQLRQRRSRESERLTATSKRRWAAVRFMAKGRVAWALWSAYARQADRRDRERARNRFRAGVRAAVAQHPRTGWREWLRDRAGHSDVDARGVLRTPRVRREGAPESRHHIGSTLAAGVSSAAGSGGPRKSHRGRPRAATTLLTLSDLRGLSSMPAVRFGLAPEMPQLADPRPHLEQRRTEQSDSPVQRNSVERVGPPSTDRRRRR